MKQLNWFEKYISWPLNDLVDSIRIKILSSTLEKFGMDWGKWPIEEISKMYSKYGHEINRND